MPQIQLFKSRTFGSSRQTCKIQFQWEATVRSYSITTIIQTEVLRNYIYAIAGYVN